MPNNTCITLESNIASYNPRLNQHLRKCKCDFLTVKSHMLTACFFSKIQVYNVQTTWYTVNTICLGHCLLTTQTIVDCYLVSVFVQIVAGYVNRLCTAIYATMLIYALALHVKSGQKRVDTCRTLLTYLLVFYHKPTPWDIFHSQLLLGAGWNSICVGGGGSDVSVVMCNIYTVWQMCLCI